MNDYHIPVLLDEAIELLKIKKEGKYIDCTLGGGGHTQAILDNGGLVLAIDQDPEAIGNAQNNFKIEILNKRLFLKHGNFAHLDSYIQEIGWNQVDGVLMDLGVSSHQLETSYRGFSFNKEADLDMRMDQSSQYATAKDLINGLGEKELKELFIKLGEENFAGPIARKIVESRKVEAITTTNHLAKIILAVRRKGTGDRSHPATRVFQALRIAVNDELNSLREALPRAVDILSPGGILAVISFHSLEDRIVKEFFNNKKKPIEPTEKEIQDNSRARSGKLRYFEKLKAESSYE